MKTNTRFSLGIILVAGLFLSACSQTGGSGGASQQSTDEGATVATGTAHTHPANECTNSISHTHPNGAGAHKHRYSCKGNGSMAGQHRHPANKCTKTVSHAHSSGKGTHAHRYSCKGNGRSSSANGHFHPANSMTNSTRHNHPNGAGKHSHHYSM